MVGQEGTIGVPSPNKPSLTARPSGPAYRVAAQIAVGDTPLSTLTTLKLVASVTREPPTYVPVHGEPPTTAVPITTLKNRQRPNDTATTTQIGVAPVTPTAPTLPRPLLMEANHILRTVDQSEATNGTSIELNDPIGKQVVWIRDY